MSRPNPLFPKEHIDATEAYHWEEFKAFCKRAGIQWDAMTTDLTIVFRPGHKLTVTHSYYAEEQKQHGES